MSSSGLSSATSDGESVVSVDPFDRHWCSSVLDPDDLFNMGPAVEVAQHVTTGVPSHPPLDLACCSPACSPPLDLACTPAKAQPLHAACAREAGNQEDESPTGVGQADWDLASSSDEDLFGEGGDCKAVVANGNETPRVPEDWAEVTPPPTPPGTPVAATSIATRFRLRAKRKCSATEGDTRDLGIAVQPGEIEACSPASVTTAFTTPEKMPMFSLSSSAMFQGSSRCSPRFRPAPRTFPDIAWWTDVLEEAVLKVCPTLHDPPSRHCSHEALCAGTCGEKVGPEHYKLPIYTQAAADSNRLSRRFIQLSWPDIPHVVECNMDLAMFFEREEKPFCARCGGPCDGHGMQQNPDIVTGGFPCTPFTHLRQKNGSSPTTGPAHGHPAYHVLMTEFNKYLELRKPRSWWLEEVEEVLKVNPLTGSTYLEELGKRAAQQGYSSRAMVINHDCFVKVPRRRIFILGASEEAGGKEAADIAIKKVVDVLEHVRVKALKAKVPDVWDIVLPTDHEEISRVAEDKAGGPGFIFLHYLRFACPHQPILHRG